MAKKLARVGLIPNPEAKPAATLGPFLQAWLAARKGDYKPASLIAWGQVIDALTDFLGADCPLEKVTPAKGEEFRQSMLAAGLRATTIHKRLQHARMFFAHAKRQGLVDANPFEFVRHRPGDASERRAYVPAADVLRAIEHAPNGTWKLLIALSRFAGLRVPSEALSLRWQDVDWERQAADGSQPQDATPGRPRLPRDSAVSRPFGRSWKPRGTKRPRGAEYVIPEEYRRRAQGPAGWANANLRTTLEKIIRRAGLEPWPRLWHSMRASCETDLARQFPLAVVAKWLGNTQAVAMRHYVDVTDADFERAIRMRSRSKGGAKSGAAARTLGIAGTRSRQGQRMKKPRTLPGLRIRAILYKSPEWRRRESNPQESIASALENKASCVPQNGLAADWRRNHGTLLKKALKARSTPSRALERWPNHGSTYLRRLGK